MIKTLLLIFDPEATWERIARAQRGMGFLLMCQVLPLLVIGSLLEGWGLHRWGKMQALVNRVKEFSVGETIIFEVFQFVLSLAVVFIGARLVRALGETFHGRHTYRQCFSVVAYGLSPVFLMRMFDAFRGIPPWVPWVVGILLTVAVLYHGVPKVMEPDPPQAFGLYLMSSLLLFLITGLVCFITCWYIQGRFTRIEPFVSELGSRLHL